MYIVCSLSVSLPDLANKDVHRPIISIINNDTVITINLELISVLFQKVTFI